MQYLSFFKLWFACNFQYRISAIAGLATQFFWGFMMLFLYEAFYKNGINISFKWNELVSYVWLGQAFYTIVFFRVMDKEIFESIKTGQVAYEFVRPLNVYWMWYAKICAYRLSTCLLRFLPIIIFSILLPDNYALHAPFSGVNFIMFILTLLLGLLISTALAMLIYIAMFYTTSCKGLFNIYGNIADFFSGMDLPILFMPEVIQTLCFILPFRLCMDSPMRIYVGNIDISEGTKIILLQVFWIILLTVVGNFLMQRASKKLIVQGG